MPQQVTPGAATAADPAIFTTGLGRSYGRTLALRDLSLEVPPGVVFGFLGPNGAGKTTAVKLLLGLVRPTGGEGWLLGRPLGDIEARRHVGYLPERFGYQEYLTAMEVVTLHATLAGIPRSRRRGECQRAIEVVGLAERRHARVGAFSKGMQQRLGLAVALLGDPQLVILDEPTSALDPVGRHDAREIIRQLKGRGCTVFLNSHLLGEVEQVCDEIAMVDRGRVVAAGKMADLLGRPALRIRLDPLPDHVLADVADRYGLRRDGPSLVAMAVDEQVVPDIVADLCARGGRIYGVELQRPSLEERFLGWLAPGGSKSC